MRAELRRHLTDAMRQRDRIAVAAIRTALAAIENAEAVDAGAVDGGAVDGGAVAPAATAPAATAPAATAPAATAPATTAAATTSAHIAGAAAGVGATEVARRELTEEDVVAIVAAEAAHYDDAAAEYDALGRPDEADERRRQAAVLRTHLPA